MRAAKLLLAAFPLTASLLSGCPKFAGAASILSATDARRVSISAAFAGSRVFLYGQAPAGTTRVVAVMEGPSGAAVRLLKKGRVAMFYLGVRQYRLSGLPALYLVNANCPQCNRPSGCAHQPPEDDWNRVLAPLGHAAGRSALRELATLECLSGPLAGGELATVLDGYWQLQAKRGLFAVSGNAVRLSGSGAYYHAFTLAPQAPDGRYRIRTYFLAGSTLIASDENELFVRKSGIVATLSRLAERRAASYGVLTVLVALAAGWLAGALFRKGGGH